MPGPPCGAAVGRGTAAERWWRGRSLAPALEGVGPSVSASRCHLPIAARQGGAARPHSHLSPHPRQAASGHVRHGWSCRRRFPSG
ncbi:MAG: hypothetical protein EOP63_14420 [Sphingomonadales bacterium]|nr:MAG: hypothetical protein EOP63_14420 [Sphingomonadales bacterium]